jgi:hypothetical protein
MGRFPSPAILPLQDRVAGDVWVQVGVPMKWALAALVVTARKVNMVTTLTASTEER